MAHINSSDFFESRAPFFDLLHPQARPASRFVWFAAFAAGAVACVAVVWGQSSGPTEQPLADAATFADTCGRGDAVACNDLGIALLNGSGVPADAARAFERSCMDGSADACSNLGAMYERGVSVERDLDHAARLYEQSCNAGGALGCSNLGALRARGIGIAQDRDEAQRLFQLACKGGSAVGCDNLMHSAH
jgi:TPR repeat protein